MGGCATKPNSTLEDLPVEKPASLKSMPRTVEANPQSQETVDASETKNVEVQNKEEPLLDLSEPAPNAPNGDEKNEQTAAVTSLVSDIGGLKIEPAPNAPNGDEKAEQTAAVTSLVSDIGGLKIEPVDSEKAPEVNHVLEEKGRVENINAQQIKEVAVPTQDSEKVNEVGKQKQHFEGEGPSLNPERLEKKGIETSVVSP